MLWTLLLAHVYGRDEPERAVTYGGQSLALARALNLTEQLAYTLNDLGFAYSTVGQLDQSLAVLAEARTLWREQHNLPMLANSLFASNVPHFLKGEFAETVALSHEAEQISRSIGNLWGELASAVLSGLVYLELGIFGRALDSLYSSLGAAEQANLTSQSSLARAPIGWIAALLGELEAGRTLCRQAARDGSALAPGFRCLPLAMKGLVEILNGDLEAAEAAIADGWVGLSAENLATPGPVLLRLAAAQAALARNAYRRALELADHMIDWQRQAGVSAFLPDALDVRAGALMALGRLGEARVSLDEAVGIARETRAYRALWRFLSGLAELHLRLGQVHFAETLRAEARSYLTDLTEQITASAVSPERYADVQAKFRASLIQS